MATYNTFFISHYFIVVLCFPFYLINYRGIIPIVYITILFLIYINDITKSSSLFLFYFYIVHFEK